ncbi:defender against death DAD protein [Choiromyces venosus 120613-1]|uniref:Dolichyl-diphosphooligosaccharide--protein glycosyltransferase subunit OST2 n=1 Tax=Choiromyces venosus 120613-1 TaxID=1336337 RepID=A0A3N4JUX8_9PEZI|nr:defender against death DAD protein [Choiromyces venosus 120613-1]
MPPKKNVSTPSSTSAAPSAAVATPISTPQTSHNVPSSNPISILEGIFKNYSQSTPQRTKLIDAFLGFLVITGVLQFVYCVVAGNYPFNAFLAGFSATVGQFVLTASLRIQSNPANKSEFASVSPERAFADFVFCSIILHLFCTNFIN